MMALSKNCILTLNAGSSSLKFSFFEAQTLSKQLWGVIKQSPAGLQFTVKGNYGGDTSATPLTSTTIQGAIPEFIKWIQRLSPLYPIDAIGFRIVQGGPNNRMPTLVTDKLVKEMQRFAYLAPNHIPDEITLIKAFRSAFPNIPQAACFDTCFHKDMPDMAKYYPLPAEYREQGLIKYGFHGLSYEYIMSLLHANTPNLLKKKIIIAHLGNGASMAAIKRGISIDTTMGLSPLGGLVMGTRSGDLDPAVVLFLLNQGKLNAAQADELLSKNAGLKAIAGTNDMEFLLQHQKHDDNAKAAIAVFCYTAQKTIGALAAAMGGLDMLVFTGGIGENAALIRELICRDLGFLGINLNKQLNNNHYHTISRAGGRVTVKVLPTDEEWIIAKHIKDLLTPTE